MTRRGQATVRPEDLLSQRKRAGFSQAALGAAAGCSEALVFHAERGSRNLSIDSVLRFAAALGCTPTDIADIDMTAEQIDALVKAFAA